MINYGVVYPQAILIFVVTILYSVIQPTILIFGALYFGIGYVVYKYKLLFGKDNATHYLFYLLMYKFLSVLQTLRIAGSGLANHLHAPHMGHHHLPDIHDGYFLIEKRLRSSHFYGSTAFRYRHMGDIYRQCFQATE